MSLSDLQSRIAVLISADGSGAIKEMQKVGQTADRDLGKATSNIDKLGNRLTYGGAAAMGFAAMAGGALYSFAKASDEAHQYELRLQNSMKNSPALANANIQSFKNLAQAIQGKTAADGDMILGSMAVLAQFKLTEDQIKKVTPLVVDYARKMGVDMDAAAKNVAKAIDGKAMALQKSGIKLDESTYKTDRFKAVMDGLRGTVGGFAEQEGQTFSGKLERFKNQMGDLKESIGSGVITTIAPLAGGLGHLAQGFSEVNEKTGGFVGKLATVGTGAVGAVGALSFLSGQFIKMREQMISTEGGLTAFGKAATGIAAIGVGFALFEGLKALAEALKPAGLNMERLNKEFEIYKTSGRISGQLQGEIDSFKRLATSISYVNIEQKRNLEAYEKYAVRVNQNSNSTKNNPISTYRVEGLDDAAKAQDRIKKLDDQLAALVNSGNGDAAAKLFKEIESSALRGGESVDGVSAAFPRFSQAQADAKNKSADAAQTLLDQTRNMNELGESAEGATRSIGDLFDAQQRFADASLSAEEKTIRLRQEYEKYVADMQSGKLSTDDNTLAQGRLIGSNVDLARTLADARIQQLGVTDSQQQSIIKHDILIQTLQAAKKQYPELAGKIDEYIRYLNSIPASKDTRVNANVAPAQETINQFAQNHLPSVQGWLNRNPLEVPSVVRVNSGGIPGRAVGGPVVAGQAYIVGERGPELMVPNGNGSIIPNNALRAYNPPSGGTYNVTVNVAAGSHPADVGAEVVNALKAYERRNGTAWRN